jgi:hypothetical protein
MFILQRFSIIFDWQCKYASRNRLFDMTNTDPEITLEPTADCHYQLGGIYPGDGRVGVFQLDGRPVNRFQN